MPELIEPASIPSVVLHCCRCKRWCVRVPAPVPGYDALAGDKGLECDYCGCTSFTRTPGRPFGPRSRKWNLALEHWRFCMEMEN